MKLVTPITVPSGKPQIDYNSDIVLLGSCFAQNIGNKLEYFQFRQITNPLGIIFNPVSLELLVTRAINKDVFTEEDIFFHNERWHCFQSHSVLSATTKEALLDNLNMGLLKLHKGIAKASHMIFTYGTAWVYRHIDSDSIVANCHKVPQKRFLKELLTPVQIESAIDNMETLIRYVNPSVTFIHTVSPVRHTKDGMMENARSKAHLLTAVHENISPRDRSHYFPSYEIVMDELRDYRFYSEDLVHTNETAISIIWERFAATWIDPSTEETRKQVRQIRQGLAHSPFNPDGEAHGLFLKDLNEKIEAVKGQYPHMTF